MEAVWSTYSNNWRLSQNYSPTTTIITPLVGQMFPLEETSVFFPSLPKWEWTAASPLRSSGCGVSFPAACLAFEIQMQSCPSKLDREIKYWHSLTHRFPVIANAVQCRMLYKRKRQKGISSPAPSSSFVDLFRLYLYVHQESPPPAVWMGLDEWIWHVAINFLNGRRHENCVQKLLPLCARGLKWWRDDGLCAAAHTVGNAARQVLPHSKTMSPYRCRFYVGLFLLKHSLCKNMFLNRAEMFKHD